MTKIIIYILLAPIVVAVTSVMILLMTAWFAWWGQDIYNWTIIPILGLKSLNFKQAFLLHLFFGFVTMRHTNKNENQKEVISYIIFSPIVIWIVVFLVTLTKG